MFTSTRTIEQENVNGKLKSIITEISDSIINKGINQGTEMLMSLNETLNKCFIKGRHTWRVKPVKPIDKLLIDSFSM